MINSLVGTWSLVAWRRISGDNSISYPLGEDARGMLIYTPGGDMAVQISAERRPDLGTDDPLGGPEDLRAQAYSGYLAYYGTYLVEDDSVVHVVDASLFPHWSGQKQVRPLAFEDGRLVLRTPPMQLADGSTVVNELTWARPDHGS